MRRALHSRPLGTEEGTGRVPVCAGPASPRARRGFSLLELLLVLAVTLLLTGLLLPILSEVRENAHRVVCSSNLRQVGLMIVMWADDHDGCLPHSFFAEGDRGKQEMMAAHRGGDPDNWEGLGHLFKWGYCTAPEILYCPSHIGDHPFEHYSTRYEQYRHATFHDPTSRVDGWIYTNYHYAGHLDWENPAKKRRIDGTDSRSIVVATDGLRTVRDFNHRTGLNVLKGDSSVIWREDSSTRTVAGMLPSGFDGSVAGAPNFRLIWKLLAE